MNKLESRFTTNIPGIVLFLTFARCWSQGKVYKLDNTVFEIFHFPFSLTNVLA